MPLFDTRCPHCSYEEERLIKSTEDFSTLRCGKCGGLGIQKVFNASGQSFRLYGEGFVKRTHKDSGDFG